MLCFPLLRWIITSNRCHLEAVPREKQIKELQTEYQFIMKSATPEKEGRFQAEKKVAVCVNVCWCVSNERRGRGGRMRPLD